MKRVRSDKRNWGWAGLRAGASFTSSPPPSTPVIPSGVNASRSEAFTQSKALYSQIEAEACGQSFEVNPRNSEFRSTDRGPSTPPVHSQANEQPPLRMTAWSCPDEIHGSRAVLNALKSCMSVFTAMLREIFDETAYARFLNQRQLASSRSAYAAFRQEHEISKARRPKCC
jgi:hypothetical protein